MNWIEWTSYNTTSLKTHLFHFFTKINTQNFWSNSSSILSDQLMLLPYVEIDLKKSFRRYTLTSLYKSLASFVHRICYWLQIENEACLASKKQRLRCTLLKICTHVCSILIASCCATQYYIARLQFWGNLQSTCNQKCLKRFANAHAQEKRRCEASKGKVVQIHDDASQVELQAGKVRLQSSMRICMHWKAMHCN